MQAQLPEQMLEPTPRFGPAAKAARAKEREEEAARLAKEKKAAAAAKPAAKPQCAPGWMLRTWQTTQVDSTSSISRDPRASLSRLHAKLTLTQLVSCSHIVFV